MNANHLSVEYGLNLDLAGKIEFLGCRARAFVPLLQDLAETCRIDLHELLCASMSAHDLIDKGRDDYLQFSQIPFEQTKSLFDGDPLDVIDGYTIRGIRKAPQRRGATLG